MNTVHLTFEEHSKLICELIKLQLFYLWHCLKKKPELKFCEGLRNQVDLCRKTDPNPKHYDEAVLNFENPDWLKLKSELNTIYQTEQDASSFELAAFACAQPILVKFAEHTYGSSFKGGYQCGSLKYDKPKDNDPKTVVFHIANAVTPKSIFTDPGYLEQCLLDLMDKSEKEFDADSLRTHTWLNSLSKWLEYFPGEWQTNLSPASKEIQWHFGYWGQFVSARGTFNQKYANILRKTGEFPYYPCSSKCSFIELRKHLSRRHP